MGPATRSQSEDLPSWVLWAYFPLTYSITWGVIGPYIVDPEWSAERFGAISGTHPAAYLLHGRPRSPLSS